MADFISKLQILKLILPQKIFLTWSSVPRTWKDFK